MIKKFILSLAVGLMFIGSAIAETATATLTGNSPTNLVLQGPAKINGISVSSLATTNGTLTFWDSPYNTNTYTRGAFTNFTTTVFNTNRIYTNFFGVLTTNTYQVKAMTTNTAAAAVVARPQIASIVTVSNSVVTYDFDGVYVGTGLLITNLGTIGGLGGVTVTVNYDKLR